MITKLTLKKLEKLNDYVDINDEDKNYRQFHEMQSIVRRSASQHEQALIAHWFYNKNHGFNDTDIRDDYYYDVLDTYLRYNANSTIKSMCRNTKKCAKLRYCALLGDALVITKRQNMVFSGKMITKDFNLYTGQGYSEASKDINNMNLIKNGKVMKSDNPADLANAKTIMRDIRIGKKALKHPKQIKNRLKQSYSSLVPYVSII